MAGGESDVFTRHWRLWVALFWVAAVALLLYTRWDAIGWFALSDTDDNLRMMQVRGLLGGQDWYDLRQYRLDPPAGANVHWSRLVDLPIAGLILLLKPFVGGAMAEKVAVAFAPMLPMAVAMGAVAVACRRLISPKAFALGIGLLLCAHSARGMWSPLRIDHHGWQLAMLSLVLVSLTDSKRARGGALAGIATALSLAIGLELLIYLAAAGAIIALMWVRDQGQARRLAAYGASLAGGSGLFYLLFTSEANSLPVCDALSPVWLSVMVTAGALAVLLSFLKAQHWAARLGAGAVAGAMLVGGYALAWPHCLTRLEGVSPELDAMWLGNVREARPIYRHSWGVMASVVSLPVAGLVGYAVMLWRSRGDRAALASWAAVAALAVLPVALLLWQTRAGAASQLLAIPGATALAWIAIQWAQSLKPLLPRVGATVGAFAVISGLVVQNGVGQIPQSENARMKAVNEANAKCPTLAALRPVALEPKGYVLTFVDLSPRLITVTHHNAVAGPYHRNGEAILDVMKSFRGTPDYARSVIERRGIDYVLICPNLSESTVYAKEAPDGFYAQLAKDKVPAWLTAVPLPENSPYKMWRVVRR
ncbi:AcrB/AcrD/AcrF family protein [Sphingosinicella sp. LY1275]|uniref:AcrB/AcrD/AcrF family protein n=1 Tax=Sphingosinicella sp. LY1275 TaxID=3095379 RepID=UPI002ADED125|nr:AcrB/AcrD/AcrF family protein [Sphingosinicella sp. LY1275]MEA1015797.1 AcrB/AcrD/AcrF family protein [Sphingosinicella sp. LY1275]